MINQNNDPVLLTKGFKDHTVANAVEDISNQGLPANARSVHLQPIRNLDVTIQVLDEKDGSVIETITGKASGGDIRVDSNSLIRRSGSLKLAVDPDLFPQKGSLIWFNHFAKVYVGIRDMAENGKPMNFLMGTFWFDKAGVSFSADSSEITVELSDKMSQYTETQIETPLKISPGTPVDEAIRLLMENLGETKFGKMDKAEEGEVVPYTLEYTVGTNLVDAIVAIRDMYMDYVCGYNIRGEFEFKKLKVQKESEVEDPKWKFDSTDNERGDLAIAYSEDYNLNEIKNRIVVYGGTSEKTGLTPVSEVRITDPKSPFNVYAIGQRTKVITEDKYVTNEQCISMGRFEIWKTSTFQEVVNLTTVPLYLLDAFDIIEVTHPFTKVVSRYMVDSFSIGLDIGAQMTITAHKLYYVSLEYGEEKLPLVRDIINGINNWGWLSLGEERVRDAYNITGDGKATLIVRFQDNGLGGEQASVTSYPTTKNQTLMIDLADFENLDNTNENGDAGRSSADYLDRVLGHEMFHAVLNDYLGHDMAIQLPVWFNEGFAEFLHGGKERLLSAYPEKNAAATRLALTSLAESQLNGTWTGTSEDYVAAYLLAIAIYRKCSADQWTNLLIRLKNQTNPSINFLIKLLPIADTNDGVKNLLIQEIESMNNIWTVLFNEKDPDTGSVGGVHFMNLFGTSLTAESVFNNSSATTDTLGFQLKIEK